MTSSYHISEHDIATYLDILYLLLNSIILSVEDLYIFISFISNWSHIINLKLLWTHILIQLPSFSPL